MPWHQKPSRVTYTHRYFPRRPSHYNPRISLRRSRGRQRKSRRFPRARRRHYQYGGFGPPTKKKHPVVTPVTEDAKNAAKVEAKKRQERKKKRKLKEPATAKQIVYRVVPGNSHPEISLVDYFGPSNDRKHIPGQFKTADLWKKGRIIPNFGEVDDFFKLPSTKKPKIPFQMLGPVFFAQGPPSGNEYIFSRPERIQAEPEIAPALLPRPPEKVILNPEAAVKQAVPAKLGPAPKLQGRTVDFVPPLPPPPPPPR